MSNLPSYLSHNLINPSLDAEANLSASIKQISLMGSSCANHDNLVDVTVFDWSGEFDLIDLYDLVMGDET